MAKLSGKLRYLNRKIRKCCRFCGAGLGKNYYFYSRSSNDTFSIWFPQCGEYAALDFKLEEGKFSISFVEDWFNDALPASEIATYIVAKLGAKIADIMMASELEKKWVVTL